MLRTPPKEPSKEKNQQGQSQAQATSGGCFGSCASGVFESLCFPCLASLLASCLSLAALQNLLSLSARWWEQLPLICRGGGLPRTSQHKATCSTLDHCRESVLGGSSPFREGCGAAGLQVKSSLGELGCSTEQWVVLKTGLEMGVSQTFRRI